MQQAAHHRASRTQVECSAQAAAAPALFRALRPRPVPLQRTLEQAASTAAQKLLPRRPQTPPAPERVEVAVVAEPLPGVASNAGRAAVSVRVDGALPLQEHPGPAAPGMVQESRPAPQQQQQPPSSAELLHCVQSTRDIGALHGLFRDHLDAITPEHVHALLQRLASSRRLRTLSHTQRARLDALLEAACAALRPAEAPLQPAQLAGIPAALAALHHQPPLDWVQGLMARAYTQMDAFTVDQLAQLITGAAQLRGRNTRTSARAAASATAAPGGVAAAVGAASSVSGAWLRRFMGVLEQRLVRRDGSATPHQLYTLAVSLQALGAQPPPGLLYVYVRALSSVMHGGKPRELAAVLGALAHWKYRLPRHVAAQFEQLVGAGLHKLHPGEVATVLHALAALRQAPPASWTRDLVAAALRGSAHLSAHAVVLVLAAVAALGAELAPDALDLLLLQARQALHVLSPPECIGLMDALAAYHHRPGPGFMASYMEEAQRHLPGLSFEQLAALITALAAVAYRPQPQWMAQFMRALLRHAPAPANVPALMRLMGALRRMQYTPPGEAMTRLEAHIDRLALQLDFDVISRLRAALSDLQYEAFTAASAAAAAAAREASATAAADAASASASATARAIAAPAESEAAAAAGESSDVDADGADEEVFGARVFELLA